MQLLGRHQWKTTREIKAHLIAEHGLRTGSGAIIFQNSMVADMPHEIKILAHDPTLANSFNQNKMSANPGRPAASTMVVPVNL